jgi:hypothetical protein
MDERVNSMIIIAAKIIIATIFAAIVASIVFER